MLHWLGGFLRPQMLPLALPCCLLALAFCLRLAGGSAVVHLVFLMWLLLLFWSPRNQRLCIEGIGTCASTQVLRQACQQGFASGPAGLAVVRVTSLVSIVFSLLCGDG